MAIKISASNTINGNYTNAPRQSCKPIDVPTIERIMVELDGETYERTVYERWTWKNSAGSKLLCRFVTIDGTNYVIA